MHIENFIKLYFGKIKSLQVNSHQFGMNELLFKVSSKWCLQLKKNVSKNKKIFDVNFIKELFNFIESFCVQGGASFWVNNPKVIYEIILVSSIDLNQHKKYVKIVNEFIEHIPM